MFVNKVEKKHTTAARAPTSPTRLQITITVNMRTLDRTKKDDKKKLCSIYTVYYVY